MREVQSFLGIVNFNRKFIKDFSKIARPLSNLTKKNQPFVWTRECQDAFNRLIQKTVKAPMLRTFDNERSTRIKTNASNFAIGAYLS